MAKLNECVYVFHNVNSILYAVTKHGFLVKLFKYFHSINLTLSQGGKYSHKKQPQTRKQCERWQKIQGSKIYFKQVTQYFLNILHQIYMSQKLFIHHWKATCNSRDTNRGFKFGIRPFE